MEHTRKQRLDNECSHREYFAQFVTEMTKETVLHRIGLNTILASTDNAMNDIELNAWDVLPDFPRATFDHMKKLGDFMTMAGKVCIYKEAAKQIQENTFKTEMNEFLKAHCHKISSTDEYGCKRSDGSTMIALETFEIPPGFKEQEHWNSQSRTVWINDRTLSTITYCEGDIIVMQHSTQASYNKEIVKAAEYYKTH